MQWGKQMMWSTVRQERKKEKKVKGNRCSTSHMSEGKLRGCLVHHFKKKKKHTCFQTTLQIFLHTFPFTCISTHIFQQQNTCF